MVGSKLLLIEHNYLTTFVLFLLLLVNYNRKGQAIYSRRFTWSSTTFLYYKFENLQVSTPGPR